MISSFMLDTSTCIDILRGRRGAARARFKAEQGNIHLSTVALAELLLGPLKVCGSGRHEEELDAFLARVRVLDFDADAALHTADIRADLERRGIPIGPYDFQIAGHARSLGMTVVTGNLREFSRVEGLRCEDWLSSVQGFSK